MDLALQDDRILFLYISQVYRPDEEHQVVFNLQVIKVNQVASEPWFFKVTLYSLHHQNLYH